jgi:hypothetical protein
MAGSFQKFFTNAPHHSVVVKRAGPAAVEPRSPMRFTTIVAAAAALSATACSSLGGGHALPNAGTPVGAAVVQRHGFSGSVLKTLTKQVVIGSVVDPDDGDQNPYGLLVATTSSGNVKKGRLYACNFNDKANVQGNGSTIVSLAPTPGSTPQRFAQSNSLLGCAALAMAHSGEMFAASYSSKAASELTTSGSVSKVYKKGLSRPFGAAFAIAKGTYIYTTTALFVSDAATGSIVLAQSCSGGGGCTYPGTPIVTGFAVNHGKPGSILGPSGLTFDPNNCVKIGRNPACGTLYVVDGVTNTVVAIHNALNLRKAGSIVVGKTGKTFGGTLGSWAKLVYAGSPLNAPISAALLFNGNLVVGNTGNPKGKNLLVEISPAGKVLDVVNVDKGPAGALFGIAATGFSAASTHVYFNDDNANNVQALEK